jgi:hypothetical protein
MIHAIIVPEVIRDACNEAAVQLGIDPDGTLNTLCVPLVPTEGPDDGEPTHWGARGIMPEAARDFLASNLDQFPGAMWWRWNDERRLVASHESADLGKFWDWDNCLARAGLKVRKKISPSL